VWFWFFHLLVMSRVLEPGYLQRYNMSWCEGAAEHEILKIFDGGVVTLKMEKMERIEMAE
jgi:hypothetical protein